MSLITLTISTSIEVDLSIEANISLPGSHDDPGERASFYVDHLSHKGFDLPRSVYYYHQSEFDEAISDHLRLATQAKKQLPYPRMDEDPSYTDSIYDQALEKKSDED